MKTRIQSNERGFTLVELAIATVVLLVGVMAVLQLVPAAMESNRRNRWIRRRWWSPSACWTR
jgi:prepilin-type N-terminal cleavage/methylation domain